MDETIREVLELEESRCNALLAGDCASLEAMTADELLYTHSGAYRDTKTSWLEWIKSGRVKYKHIEHSNIQTQRHGDTIFVLGQARHEAERDGVPSSATFLYSVAWVKTADGWRFAFWHATQFPSRA